LPGETHGNSIAIGQMAKKQPSKTERDSSSDTD